MVKIKLLHTTVWLFFAGCIVAIPLAGYLRQFRWVAILSGLVLMECAVLALNHGRCPLTDLAGRYTEERKGHGRAPAHTEELARPLSGKLYTEPALRVLPEGRAANFDIYLPLWLARRNKAIFGTLFVVGELFALGCWFFQRTFTR